MTQNCPARSLGIGEGGGGAKQHKALFNWKKGPRLRSGFGGARLYTSWSAAHRAGLTLPGPHTCAALVCRYFRALREKDIFNSFTPLSTFQFQRRANLEGRC